MFFVHSSIHFFFVYRLTRNIDVEIKMWNSKNRETVSFSFFLLHLVVFFVITFVDSLLETSMWTKIQWKVMLCLTRSSRCNFIIFFNIYWFESCFDLWQTNNVVWLSTKMCIDSSSFKYSFVLISSKVMRMSYSFSK